MGDDLLLLIFIIFYKKNITSNMLSMMVALRWLSLTMYWLLLSSRNGMRYTNFEEWDTSILITKNDQYFLLIRGETNLYLFKIHILHDLD